MTFIPQTSFTSLAGIERSHTVALFIHGITEGPNQFREAITWTNALQIDAVALVLPGHGGTAEEFAHSGRDVWEKFVDQEVERYRKEYTNIILVGHSMGGLLSILTSLRHPHDIAGVITIGCPLHVWVAPRAVRNLLELRYLPSLSSTNLEAMRRIINVAPGATLGYWNWIPRLRDLFALMHDVRQNLHRLHIPLLAIQGEQDELVDAHRSMTCYREQVPTEYLQTLLLPQSNHFRYPKDDLQMFRETFTTFCKTVATPP